MIKAPFSTHTLYVPRKFERKIKPNLTTVDVFGCVTVSWDPHLLLLVIVSVEQRFPLLS
jgi:hypothetical protein